MRNSNLICMLHHSLSDMRFAMLKTCQWCCSTNCTHSDMH